MGSSVEGFPLQLANLFKKKQARGAENEVLLLLFSHANGSCPIRQRMMSASDSRRNQRQHGDSLFSPVTSTPVVASQSLVVWTLILKAFGVQLPLKQLTLVPKAFDRIYGLRSMLIWELEKSL